MDFHPCRGMIKHLDSRIQHSSLLYVGRYQLRVHLRNIAPFFPSTMSAIFGLNVVLTLSDGFDHPSHSSVTSRAYLELLQPHALLDALTFRPIPGYHYWVYAVNK
jgi:hypothetical protein